MRNANGFGSIVKLSGNRRKKYACRITTGWTDTGKQKYKYISYHTTKKEAAIALAEYNKSPFNIETYNMTFKEVYDKWSTEKYKSISKSTRAGYEQSYKRSKPLYNKAFKDIRTVHLQEIVNQKDTPELNRKLKSFFGRLYEFARANDIIEKDYSEFLSIDPPKEKVKKEIFTKAEIDKLWSVVDEVQYVDIVLILLYTGMRIGELLDIKTKNIYLEERYMIGGLKTEAGIDRIIPIHKKILPLIEKWFNPKNKTLIVSKKGSELTYTNFQMNYWKYPAELFDIPHTAHETRHTFITRTNELELNRLYVKRIVGHSIKDITDHYTAASIEMLVKEIDKFDY